MPEAGPPFPEITATSTTYPAARVSARTHKGALVVRRRVAGHASKYAFWSSVMLRFGRNTGIRGTGHRRTAEILPARASRRQNLLAARAAARHVPGLTKTGRRVHRALFVRAQLPSPNNLHRAKLTVAQRLGDKEGACALRSSLTIPYAP
jgi:hypothetical protein